MATIHGADDLPDFDSAPPAILIAGEDDFFVEDAAERARARLAAEGVEVLRFDDEDPPEAVADALLNRSLFSPRRLVEVDLSSWLGRESLRSLLADAVEAWEQRSPAGRRAAFRKVTALRAAARVGSAGSLEEEAAALAERTRLPEASEALLDILRAMPPERGAQNVGLQALRIHLSRRAEGTVLLARAVDPPRGDPLIEEVGRVGLVWEVASDEEERPALLWRLARSRARDRCVTLEDGAIQWLLTATGGDARAFDSELGKLLEWAGEGGRVGRAEAVAQVEDRGAEDLFALLEAIGRRDAAASLEKLSRLLSGRPIKMGEREVGSDEPHLVVFGVLVSELRKMAYVRARLDESGARGFDPSVSYGAYQARYHPALAEPVFPFASSPMASGKPYGWYKVACRAARYSREELVGALRRAARVDEEMKTSAPPAEVLTAFVAGLVVAGGGLR